MTKKEKVLAVIERRVDGIIPSGFWLHFPEDCMAGDASFDAHMKFFRESGTDITKIMNESVVPPFPIKAAADWRLIKGFTKESPWIKNQIELSKRILDAVGDDGFVVQTVHGIVASAWHARGGTAGYDKGAKEILATWLREDPDAVMSGWDAITDGLCILTEESRRIGLDGIYYAALGGESYLFTDEEHEKYIKPLELRILAAAHAPGDGRPFKTILHICKDSVILERFKDYPCDVINWGTHGDNPSLAYGCDLFADKVILGGLEDRSGVLVDGTEEELAAACRALALQMAGRPFILGADCTLPTEIAYSRIKAAAKSVEAR